MTAGNYDPRAVFNERRKKRMRKYRMKRIFFCLATVIITTALILGGVTVYKLIKGDVYDEGFVPWVYGRNISAKVKKAQNTEIPEWIDVNLINIHGTARSGKYLSDIKNIVIHYVGNPNSTAANNRDYFNKLSTGVSSHFIVGLEGEIIQCVPLHEKSAASNNRNRDTISIEVCHPDESGKYSDVTYDSLVKLTAWLCHEFGLDKDDIIRHYDITGKICPKYYVENEDEWEDFKEDVKQNLKDYEN